MAGTVTNSKRVAEIKLHLGLFRSPMPGDCDFLIAEIERLRQLVERLKTRQQELLLTIRRLSIDAIDPTEADELRGQIASLISEVGTLRQKCRLDGGCQQR